MGIFRDVLDILHTQGLRDGSSLLLKRVSRRTVHLLWLIIDIPQAFLQWLSFFWQSRRYGRRLVCITLIEHLGDIVACEPVARYVRGKEQNALIVWCAKRSYEEIVAQFRGIDGLIHLRCLTTWIALRKWARFDKIIDLHINGRSCLLCHIPLRKEEGDPCITMSNYLHHGTLLGSFCLSAGLPALNDQPELKIPKNVVMDVERWNLFGPLVVIHCLSNETSKNWKLSHWNDLVDQIHKLYGVVVIEIGLQSQLNRPDSSYYRNLCGKCSILQSAELIKRSLLFIGVDSGPAHLANAVGTFGVILLGDYRAFQQYLPYTGAYADGSGAMLLRAKGEASLIMFSEVIEAVNAKLATIFC